MGATLRARIQEKVPELRNEFTTTYVGADERKSALNTVLRNHQNVHVTDHFRKSTKNLNLHYDENGILRCYGRLERAHIPELTKRSVFIAAKTPLAQCIVKNAYLPLHLSTSHTMARVRERFWIPKLRQQVQTRSMVRSMPKNKQLAVQVSTNGTTARTKSHLHEAI